MAKYGQRMDEEMPNQDWERDYTKGQIRITVKNTLPQTVTYAELAMSKPTPKGECPYPSQRKHLYAFKVKPGSSAVLVVPDGIAMLAKDGTSCIRVRAVRGREPSMLDVSIGAVMPLTESEVEGVNRDLNERYATIDPPSNYTPGRRGIEFNFTPEELFKGMNDASGRK